MQSTMQTPSAAQAVEAIKGALGLDVHIEDRLMDVTGGVDSSGNGPQDCRRDCHNPECERRHLDQIELSRFEKGSGFKYPRKPHLIITASPDMGGTASTWVFNAVRLLHRRAREACDSYWMRVLAKDKLRERLTTGANVLVKTHEWTDHMTKSKFDRLVPMFTHVIVSVREGRTEDPAWMKVATYVVHYEDIVDYEEIKFEDEEDKIGARIGVLGVLRGLAEHLGIKKSIGE